MSKENRKKEYDKLIAAGRQADIDPGLTKEFGSVLPPAKPTNKLPIPTKSVGYKVSK